MKMKIGKIIKSSLDWGYKGVILASSIAMYVEPVMGSALVIAGICSSLSTVFSDKTKTKFDKLNQALDGLKIAMNCLALNFGKAANDPKENK